MTTGAILSILCIVLIIAFLLVDLVAWIWGKAGEQNTMSQYIIARKEKSKKFRYSVIGILLAVCAVLIWHWELLI